MSSSGLAQHLPRHIWAQFFAPDYSTSSALNVWTPFRRHSSSTTHPLIHGRSRDAQQASQFSLTTNYGARTSNRFKIHGRNVAPLHRNVKPRSMPDCLASLSVKTWTPEEEARRLAERFRGVNQADFARTHGVPGGPSMVSQHIKGRRPISMDAAIAYCRGFGVSLAEISPRLADQALQASAYQPLISEQSSSGLSLIAHPVTLDKLTVVPTISWEALVSLESLPEVFKLAAPDTSMTPKVLQGTMVELTRNLTPRPGDGVLVRDREGHHYLRVYREKRPGHWEAYAINDAYSPLDSQADGLVVVAVLTAMAGRWA